MYLGNLIVVMPLDCQPFARVHFVVLAGETLGGWGVRFDGVIKRVYFGMHLYTFLERPMIDHLHHVQLAMPAGQETRAIGYYCDLLGCAQEAKPASLAHRGGVWFRNGAIRLHLGVETPFIPAKKAHPAFMVNDLDALAHSLCTAGHEVDWDDNLPGFRRFYSADPFGNRIEFMQPRTI